MYVLLININKDGQRVSTPLHKNEAQISWIQVLLGSDSGQVDLKQCLKPFLASNN